MSALKVSNKELVVGFQRLVDRLSFLNAHSKDTAIIANIVGAALRNVDKEDPYQGFKRMKPYLQAAQAAKIIITEETTSQIMIRLHPSIALSVISTKQSNTANSEIEAEGPSTHDFKVVIDALKEMQIQRNAPMIDINTFASEIHKKVNYSKKFREWLVKVHLANVIHMEGEGNATKISLRPSCLIHLNSSNSNRNQSCLICRISNAEATTSLDPKKCIQCSVEVQPTGFQGALGAS